MSAKPQDGANLDAASFDLDSWIDDVVRPEVVVELYPYEIDFAAKIAAIQAQIPAAEKSTPENRGIDEASPGQLSAQLAELWAERTRTALKVRVRQITGTEINETAEAAKAAGADEDGIQSWLIAKACVEPTFTAEQLDRLRTRDRSGEAMVAQLQAAIMGLLAGLPVPSSPAS